MNIRSLLLILLLSACAQSKYEPSKMTTEVCQEMAGKGSKRIIPSNEIKEIFSNVLPSKVNTKNILWYTENEHTYYACVYTKDKSGCGANTYRLSSTGGAWESELVSSLEKICVLK